MRVLMLNYEYPPLGGGAANANRYILEALTAYPEVEVELVTSSIGRACVKEHSPGKWIHYLDIGKKGNIHYQKNRDLLAYAAKAFIYARRLVKAKEFDVCHAFFGIPCGVLAWRLGLPYIVSLRGSDVPFYNERFKQADRLLFRRLSVHVWKNAGAVIANSKGLRDLALQSAPQQTIDIIPNGVDAARFRSRIAVDGNLRILTVARLIPRKGIEYLIDAIAQMRNRPVELTIVGEGTRMQELQEQAEREGIAAQVKFLGAIEHESLPEVYKHHDVFVLPSLNEGMSNTVLEAMASGLPILMTDTGGAAELVTPGVNGFFIKGRSAESIVEHLGPYLADRSLCDRHGEASRERATAQSWDWVAASYVKCYGTLANGR